MGYPQHAAAAYAAIDPCLTTPGRAEAMVFAKITRRMRAVFADESATVSARVSILHDNRRLWHAVALSCASDANAMAPELRASLIGLAGFVDRHTSAVLRKEGEPEVLCEINQRIAAGLSVGAT
ncbi:flagellar biosynthesis regulator FlaF [uncultured Jannaschia sp.]|uniref:flagellar biosynthesis regulator FlaF n=1 Tax=uncultured Jannaschia sp. TaxID=293347 RepID=UPI00260C2132|nr:flagellar biosynthesis regulator FlaF [uncultured Jannaschia sp.]